MRGINREIGLDDALRNMGVATGHDRSDNSSGEEKSRSPKREVQEIEMKN